MNLKNKTVVVTGASRGIGLACSKKFVENGWNVVGIYLNSPADELSSVTWVQADVADYRKVISVFDKFPRVDCLVNCAGIFGYKTLEQYDEVLMNRLIDVNEKGTYFCTKEAVKKMGKGSTIVNISSTAAQSGSSDPIYAATKAAILGFTKSMAKALAPDIRVNAIAPGVTESDMTKNMNPERLKQLIDMTLLKKIASPEEMANAVYFLASKESSHITGACLDVNGGYVLR